MSKAPTVTPELLRKYDRPGPRYTSYPTAVEFAESYGSVAYEASLASAARRVADPLSLYLHLPFCEHRCNFCGCNVIITRQREVAADYLSYLHREIREVARRLGERRRVVQYHWGGGTPTYLSPAQMRELHGVVTESFRIEPDAETAIEVDPRVTTHEQIDLLRDLGFNRLSMGVQDFADDVQEAVNRRQTESQTRSLYAYCRERGFASINLDLIYGLPLQTPESFARTIRSVAELRPDRLAVYSYAHVPWIRGNQKGIEVADLPPPDVKLRLFCLAREALLEAGYRQVGMDHFALPQDELSLAIEKRILSRNFMGYTVKTAPDMIGLGVSAIGDVDGAYAQNTKKLSRYSESLDAGQLPVERGYRLSPDDRLRRHVITMLMCNFHLDKRDVEKRFGIRFDDYFAAELAELVAPDGPVDHGFCEPAGDGLSVLALGQLFVRNLAMIFDPYLRTKTDGRQIFSRTV